MVSGSRFLFWVCFISFFMLAYLSIAYRVVAAREMTCWALVVAVADFRGASACFWTTRELLVRMQLGHSRAFMEHMKARRKRLAEEKEAAAKRATAEAAVLRGGGGGGSRA